jgi:hypothetical protein
MKRNAQILLYTFTAFLTLSAGAHAEDKASVERTIHQDYQEIQEGYARKDVDRVFSR